MGFLAPPGQGEKSAGSGILPEGQTKRLFETMRHISYISFDFSGAPAAKALIAVNVGAWFFLSLILQKFFLNEPLIFRTFGLVPETIFQRHWIWQIFTYMFLHASGLFHLLFNMFVLWMFGSELERFWGSGFFLSYCLFCGAGAALIYLLCAGVWTLGFGGDPALLQRPVIGFSGAVFGLLLAYGMIFGGRLVYLMGIFPMKARSFVILIAAIELVSVLDSGLGGPVANLAHLGGLASGLAFLKIWRNGQGLFAALFGRLRRRAGLAARFRRPRRRAPLKILRKKPEIEDKDDENGGIQIH